MNYQNVSSMSELVDSIKTKNAILIDYKYHEGPLATFYSFQDKSILNYRLSSKEEVIDLSPTFFNAHLFQDEIYDLYGLRTNNYNNNRPFLSQACKGHPRNDNFEFNYDQSREAISLWPHFPLQYQSENNYLHNLGLDLGRYHIGVEQEFIGVSVEEFPKKLEAFFPDFGIFFNYCFWKGIESISHEKPCQRFKSSRIILLELMRIRYYARHLSKLFFHLKLPECVHFYNELGDMINSLKLENQSAFNFNTILNHGFYQNLRFQVINALKRLESLHKDISSLSLFHDQLNLRELKKEDVFNFGLTGPMAKSIGLNIDYRMHTSSDYYDYQLSPPLSMGEGTDFDRYLVLVEEVKLSFNIILQMVRILLKGNSFEKGNYQGQDCHIQEFFEGPVGLLGLEMKVVDKKIDYLRFISSDLNIVQFLPKYLNGLYSEVVSIMSATIPLNQKIVDR